MSMRWKIAVLADPLTALVADAAHPLGLAQQLSSRGHEVRVIGPPSLMPSLLTGGDASGDSASEPRARRPKAGASVALFDPDAIVAYDALSPAAWLGARASRRRGAPLVLIEEGAWGAGRPLQRALWRVGESLWGRYVRRTATGVLALEPQARERSLRRGFDPSRVRSVAHGVDLELHRPGRASDELARRRIRGRILSCRTSYAATEAVEALIGAFSATVGQREDWSLVVVGDGTPPARVAKAPYRSGVGSRVHFLDLAADGFAQVLSSSTLFAAVDPLATRAAWDVERALACGVPALIPHHARGAHLVEHDVRGWVLEHADLAGWASALGRAAASPQARRRWSAAARGYALEQLGWSAVARAVETLIEDRVEATAARADAAARTAASV